MTLGSKPFLKWGGGKYRLVETILKVARGAGGDSLAHLRYIEPFLGGGAVFFGVGGKFGQRAPVLSDTNADLVDLYNILATDKGSFINGAEAVFKNSNTEAEFYKKRDAFNAEADKRKRAALFVYLNRHCYNGLCRYNSKGLFNTPFGKYVSPYFPREELETAAARLRGNTVLKSDFRDVLEMAGEGDLVYCDPPYLPVDEEKLGEAGGFTAYAAGGFGLNDQVDLADAARAAQQKGAIVLISNHDTPTARRIYKGAKFTSFPVSRMISCKADGRAKVQELIAVF